MTGAGDRPDDADGADALSAFVAASQGELLAVLGETEAKLAAYQLRIRELQRRVDLVRSLLAMGEAPAVPALPTTEDEPPAPDPRDLLGRRAALIARERAAAAARAAGGPDPGDPSADWHRFKYAALEQWLREKPNNRPIHASFEQIEAIIGRDLPASSRKYAAHWHGWEGSAVARSIHRAGWKVRHLDLREETLMFVPDVSARRNTKAPG